MASSTYIRNVKEVFGDKTKGRDKSRCRISRAFHCPKSSVIEIDIAENCQVDACRNQISYRSEGRGVRWVTLGRHESRRDRSRRGEWRSSILGVNDRIQLLLVHVIQTSFHTISQYMREGRTKLRKVQRGAGGIVAAVDRVDFHGKRDIIP